MAKSLDSQFNKAKKAITKSLEKFATTVGKQTFKTVTPNSFSTGLLFGSPVLTGRYYNSHKISLNMVDRGVAPVNPLGEESPYDPLPDSLADITLKNYKLGDEIIVSNSLPYSEKLEGGFSRKAPNGIYRVAAQLIKVRFKGAQKI